MQTIISIVGRSDSGKTTLLVSLIAELKRRGHRVAVIKHSGEDFELDTENKDTWRFSQAGSEVSAITSGRKLAIFRQLAADFAPQELSRYVSAECDLILTEGFKKSSFPKIEVHRREQGGGLLSPPQQLLAVVTDEPLDVAAPQFARDDIPGIADLVEQTMLAQPGDDVELLVNDCRVPVDAHLSDLLARTLIAMASGGDGAAGIHSLQVSLRRKR